MIFDAIITYYKEILHFIAEIAVHTMELIGIIIVVVGAINGLIDILSKRRRQEHVNVMIHLGRTLALALEFKMGAEIVNTVIVRNLEELGILAIVIALRAVLALLIHWEIKNEEKLDKVNENSDGEK